ncbi:MAG: hypothetical protein J7M24_04690, partial [Candidatus Latescibacteria bacterium]|nr:hypothetical protein [Candidatus Latescibacterota bacterium]
MKRRDMLKSLPLGLAGMAAYDPAAAARRHMCRNCASGADEQYGMTYVKKVAGMLKWVRAHQMENILEGAYAIARAVDEGRNIWSCWDLGHTNGSDLFPGRNGKPAFLVPGYDFDKVKNGDLVLANFPWPAGYIDDLAKRDLFIVGGPCPWGGDLARADLIVPDIAKLKIRP